MKKIISISLFTILANFALAQDLLWTKTVSKPIGAESVSSINPISTATSSALILNWGGAANKLLWFDARGNIRYSENLPEHHYYTVWGLSANRLVLKSYGSESGTPATFRTYTIRGKTISNTVLSTFAEAGDDEGGGDHFGFFTITYSASGDIVIKRYRY